MEAKSHAVELPLEPEIEWFLDHLKVVRGASGHTAAAYRNDLFGAAAFLRESGMQSWRDLDAERQMAFEATLGPPLAPATAQRRLSALRSLLKFLKRNGQGPSIDLPSTGGFRRRKRMPKALASPRMEALADQPNLEAVTGLRDRVLLELLYGLGLRVSEAVSLEVGMIDFEGEMVRVSGKRGKQRVIPLPSETRDWIRRYLAEARPQLAKKPIAPMVLGDRGGPLSRQRAYEILAKYARSARIESALGPHTLRHTYAVHLLKGGADLRAVQELLGHESVATTQVYTMLDLEEVKQRYRSAHPRA
jgi:integrase/recombinase XerD